MYRHTSIHTYIHTMHTYTYIHPSIKPHMHRYIDTYIHCPILEWKREGPDLQMSKPFDKAPKRGKKKINRIKKKGKRAE